MGGVVLGSDPASISVGGAALGRHRHVCAFFCSAEDEYKTLLPFICDGLDCGQRAFHVVPFRHRADHVERLREAGIDVDKAQANRQLEIALTEGTYLREGRFNAEDMLDCIQEALSDGAALGFPLTRVVAHAESVVDSWPTANAWVEYEMRANHVLSNYDDPVICAYDTNLLDANLALDILRTHPAAIIGGALVENSYFSRPEDFLREVRARTGPPQAYRR
jgi:hypothetical protein